MATFSTKSLHFPGGVPKKPKKPKILDSSGLAFAKTLKSLVLFGFFGTSSGNGNVFHQKLAFSWRGTKKPKTPKILDSSGLVFAKTLKSLVFLVFLVPPQEMATFSTKSLHFPGGVPKKNKKTKDFGLFKPRLCQDSKIFGFVWFFWYLLRKWQRFPPKACIFLEGYQKNKKNKDFGLFRPRLRQDSKIFGFVVFLVPPQEMATFSTKSLHFPRGVPKKTKKTKDFGLFRPRLRQDSKIFGFVWFFWYLLRKWQRFPPKACIFLEGYQKTKKNKDFGLFRPRLRQDSKIFGFFGFFGTSSGNGNVFHQKLAFSWRGTTKTKKTKDVGLFRSPLPRL